jgi:hypothetical protein
MSELLQSGQYPGASGHHPDADQLSAFMEQALPAHERERVLAHLAICPDCRETVVLSLPHLEAPPAPATKPARNWWFFGWPVFVPAAFALAALSFFAVYVHRANTGGAIATQSQMAASQPPAVVLPSAQASLAESAPPAAKSRPANRLSPPAGAPVSAPGAASGSGSGAAFGLVAGQRMVALAPVPQAAPAAPAAVAAENAKPTAELSAGAGAAEPPAPSANAPLRFAQTVAVTQEAPTVNTASDSLELRIAPPPAPIIVLKHSLPSGLAALSAAADGSNILAIDSHNAIFLSNDSGTHWTAVSTPWQGRALKVNLVFHARGFAPVAGALQGGNVATFADASRLSPALNASITGVITDTSGAVIPGAAVTIRNTATGAEQTVATDANGRYLADDLAPGNYDIEAKASGFMTQRVAGAPVEASKQTANDLTLQVGAVSQSVEVEAASGAATGASVAKNKARKSPAAAILPHAVFEITTDTGERWASTDGISWKHE